MPGPERRAGRSRLLPALVLVLGLALTGCTEAASTSPDGPASQARGGGAEKEPSIRSYVALGDSYTAAPLVPSTDFAEGCFRSSGNYPTLVATELGAHLRDVSCGGADTADMTARQKVTFGDRTNVAPPQLDAVGRRADLVTVGIGGNDEGLFRTLVQDCTTVAGPPGASCASIVRDKYGDASDVLSSIGRRVTDVLTQARRQAPDAIVALVGYPRLVDPDRLCAAMPVPKADAPVVAGLEERLNRTLGKAAEAAGVEYVDMHRVSRGHEICSKDPWVNGASTKQKRALAFHPFAEGEQAIADQVLALVTRLGR